MPKMPAVKAKKLLKFLLRQGYKLDRIHGSHYIVRHPNGRKASLPVHGNSELPVGTLMGILADLGISKEDLLKMD